MKDVLFLIFFYNNITFYKIIKLLMTLLFPYKKINKIMLLHLVVPPGFEPRLAEPKSDVLPLHHRTNYTFFV